MNPLPEKTRRSARRLRYATMTVMALLAALMLVAIGLLLSGRVGDFPAVHIEYEGASPAAAAAALLVMGLFVGLALWRLVGLLRRVETGQPFSIASDLRGFAFWLLLAAGAGVLAPPLAGLVSGASEIEIRFELDAAQAVALLVIALLFLVARLLDEAQAVADDASQIV